MRSGQRRVIVNADDFGRSAGVNRGVVEAHERGIVTSASLMVCWPAAEPAAAYARARRQLGLGLHLDLAEWRCRDGDWSTVYVRANLDDPGGVSREVQRQVERFRELTGRDPSHLDSHQHVHAARSVLPVVLAVARHLGIPVRGHTRGVRYVGSFYGQTPEGGPLPDGVTVNSLCNMLARLRPGITELSCHAGYAVDLDTDYRAERAVEVRTLCSADVARTVRGLGLELTSFAALLADGWTPDLAGADEAMRQV